MRSFGTALRGLFTAVATGVIVLGALSLSLTEGQVLRLPEPEPEIVFPTPNLTPLPGTITITLTQVFASATITPLVIPPTEPVTCAPPAGWERYIVLPTDSIEWLSAERRISVEELMKANCLITRQLLTGTFLYLPPLRPANTSTSVVVLVQPTANLVVYPSPVPCGAPYGWIRYRVQPGDSLFSLSQLLDVSVSELQHANCLGNSTLIRAGNWLWVPFIPAKEATATTAPTKARTSTPVKTGTFTATATSKPTETSTVTPTATVTNTSTGTATSTATATSTPTPPPTETAQPTDTEVPTSPAS